MTVSRRALTVAQYRLDRTVLHPWYVRDLQDELLAFAAEARREAAMDRLRRPWTTGRSPLA